MRGLFTLGAISALAQSGSAAICNLPLDVYFVQDTTGSFIPDLPNVKAQIPEIINKLNINNPGSRFGVAEFRDKPYLNLGELSDFCYKRNHPLSTDITSVQNAFGKLFASGGGDLPEAQFSAIIDAVNDPLVGWRPVSRNPTEGQAGARLIIMSTDATPHDPLDYELYPATAPAYMTPYPNNVSGISSDALCRRYDYPTEAQLKAQLEAHETYFAVLTPRDNTDGGKAAARWREINDVYLGNPSGFFQYIDAGSADLVTSLITVLDSVTQYVCALTTTPAPATTATATVATTTVATEPTTVATEPTTVATEPTTVATEPTTVATEPTTVATEPTTVATEPTTVATEPTTVATEPTTVATEPTTVATEPTTPATETGTVTTVTATMPTEPTTVATEPTTPATETGTVTTVTATMPTEPTTAATDPVDTLPATVATTDGEVTVSPVAPTEDAPTGPECPPVENCPTPCGCAGKYGLYVKVNDTPKKLTIDYEK